MKVVQAAQVVQLGFDHGTTIGGPQSMQIVGVGSVHHQQSNGGDLQMNEDRDGESFNRDMRELRELFSKLNPMVEEFVPPSLANNPGLNGGFNNGFGLLLNNNNGNRNGNANGFNARRRNSQGKRRMNSRTSMAQREERIRKIVYRALGQ
ncbi:polyadenylate-binding protein-interacting protein 11-like [Humulus lupulus]|uniref:polyadenylate-binding protein-interacting protein 11-like n=1 Tax=Humulus lupulus TaxID=3486 RepID=UPI002B40B07F|nr:polyadenylate-binding protein-interacting protein 11-like [Humulus lupulus]